MEVQLRRATLADAEEVLHMQREGFAEMLAAYQDMDTNPALEPLSRIQAKLAQPFTFFYFILRGEEAVGCIWVVDQENEKPKRISPLFILPQYQNQGYGQQAIRLAEVAHGSTNWQLDTISQEPRNCHLYEKMGYHATGETIVINERMTLVVYEK